MDSANILDIILVIPLLWGFYKGYTKGLIIEIATLAALILGIMGAMEFSDSATGLLKEHVSINPDYLPVIAFAVTFVAIVAGIFFLAKIIEKFIKLVALGLVNRLAGAVFGTLKFAVILSVLLLIFENIDRKVEVISPDTKKNSVFYSKYLLVAPVIVPLLDVEDLVVLPNSIPAIVQPPAAE